MAAFAESCSVLSAFQCWYQQWFHLQDLHVPSATCAMLSLLRREGRKEGILGLEGEWAKEKEFLLDHSSVSSFKALLLTPICPPHSSPSSSSVLAQHQLLEKKYAQKREHTKVFRTLLSS